LEYIGLGVFGFIALIPGLFILWLLYWKNYRHTAYLSRVVKFVAFGMLGVVPVALLEMLITYGFGFVLSAIEISLVQVILASFINAFLIASLCEESFKYLVAVLISVQPPRDVPYSVLVYSMSAAVGLATLENMMYIVIGGLRGNLFLTIFTAITRAAMAVPLHATTGVLIGADIAEKRFHVHNKSMFSILLIPFLLHGVYDFCTMFASAYIAANKDQYWIFFLPFFSLLTVIVGALYAKKRRQQILDMDVNSYIPLDVFTV